MELHVVPLGSVGLLFLLLQQRGDKLPVNTPDYIRMLDVQASFGLLEKLCMLVVFFVILALYVYLGVIVYFYFVYKTQVCVYVYFRLWWEH